MLKRLLLLAGLLALGLNLGGCSKCGWLWEDYGPQSCKNDAPK